MTRKNLFLIGITLVLAALYVIYFTDWFHSDGVQISHTSRPVTQRVGNPRIQAVFDASAPVIFFFDKELRLTRLKVFLVSELQTNQFALPLWHLVSDSNSPPLKNLTYGMPVRGMHTANKGQFAQPLVPGNLYRLFIEAGDRKGQHDFEAKPKLKGRS